MPEAPLIHAAMTAILAEVKPIAKTRTNAGQGFKFRGIDDAYEALHDLLAKHRVYCMPTVLDQRHEERTSARGNTQLWTVVRTQYTFYATDGSSVSATTLGEALDLGDKSCGKAQSYAHKVCLLQAFCIPTEDTPDPDAHSPRLGARGRPERPQQAPQPQPSAPSQPPAADEKYSGTDSQKKTLAQLIRAARPNADKTLMSNVAEKCAGVPMAQLAQRVQAILAGQANGAASQRQPPAGDIPL